MRITKKLVKDILGRIGKNNHDYILPGATVWMQDVDTVAQNMGIDCDWDFRERVAKNMIRWGWAEDRGFTVMTQLGYQEI